jgi:proline iminopeptidase
VSDLRFALKIAVGAIGCTTLVGSACRRPVEAEPEHRDYGYISVPGAQLYYIAEGRGDPIIVVPGGPGLDHTYLFPEMRRLAKAHRVIFYDPRGTGRTSGEVNDSTVSFDRLLADIDALADSLRLPAFTLLGHSWGGLVAMRYAARHPERLRALVLMNTSEPGRRYADESNRLLRARQTPEDSAQIATLVRSEAMRRGDASAVSAVLRLFFRASFADTARAKELVLALDQRTASNMSTIARLAMGPLGPSFDLWHEAATIRTPTLIVQGTQDLMPLAMPEQLAKTISGTTLVEIDHAGHFPYIERPRETFAAIDRFLASLPDRHVSIH